MEQHFTAVMIRRWLEGLSGCGCSLAEREVRNGTCSKCVVCGSGAMHTGTVHAPSVARNA